MMERHFIALSRRGIIDHRCKRGERRWHDN